MAINTSKIQPKFGLVRFSFPTENRNLAYGFLRSWGQDPKEFAEEDKVLEREAEKLDELEAERATGEKPKDDGVVRTKKFTSVEVDKRLEEIRANRLARAGLNQVRKNRYDTGGQLFGKHGVSNAVLPMLITTIIVFMAFIEITLERKPARYTERDEERAKREIDKLLKQRGLAKLRKQLGSGKLPEQIEESLGQADRIQLAYLCSIEGGKLKKTHPTEQKPYGSAQVWKYVPTVTLLVSDEDTGNELALSFEKKVFKTSYFKHAHVWLNPDGSLNIVLISSDTEEGPPKIFTVIGYDFEKGEITAKVVINKDHPEYNPEDEELMTSLRLRVTREQERLDKAMQDDEAGNRHDAQRMAQRPAPGSRLGDILQGKIDGKNGNTPASN